MSSRGPDEFSNSKYQKKLAKILLKKLNNRPHVKRTPEEIYKEFFEPGPFPCSQELIEYIIERMVQHDDGIVEWCDDCPDHIQICGSRVGEYIRTHLDTAGDPFPEVDMAEFKDGTLRR